METFPHSPYPACKNFPKVLTGLIRGKERGGVRRTWWAGQPRLVTYIATHYNVACDTILPGSRH
jgi:hypothetical protein